MSKRRRFDAEFAAMSSEEKDAFNALLAALLGGLFSGKAPQVLQSNTNRLTPPADDAHVDRIAGELLADVNI